MITDSCCSLCDDFELDGYLGLCAQDLGPRTIKTLQYYKLNPMKRIQPELFIEWTPSQDTFWAEATVLDLVEHFEAKNIFVDPENKENVFYYHQ